MNGIDKMQIESNPLLTQSLLKDRLKESAGLPEQSTGPKSDQVELSTAYQPFIQRALQEESASLQAILEARKLLENGQLDSPQSARLAAESILRTGI